MIRVSVKVIHFLHICAETTPVDADVNLDIVNLMQQSWSPG